MLPGLDPQACQPDGIAQDLAILSLQIHPFRITRSALSTRTSNFTRQKFPSQNKDPPEQPAAEWEILQLQTSMPGDVLSIQGELCGTQAPAVFQIKVWFQNKTPF